MLLSYVAKHISIRFAHPLRTFYLLAPGYEKDSRYQAVNAFLKRIPEDVIAQACFSCKAYTRALRHFEKFVSQGENIQHHLDFMQVM